MGATSTDKWPYAGVVNRKGVFAFKHRVLVGAAGAITGQDADSRVVATKQGTAGQYLIQLPRGYKRITSLDANFLGNTGSVDDDWLTDNITSNPVPGASAGTTAGNILLQLRNSAGAATDIASGAIMYLTIEVENGV